MNELPPEPTPTVPVIDKEARQWAMIAHASSLVMFLGIPFGNIVAPLLVWMFKKQVGPFVDENAKESLNFQISMTIYGIVAGILIFVLVGFALIALLFVADLVLVLVATLRADKGEIYRYPLTIRFLK
jgi:uncharacterized protein